MNIFIFDLDPVKNAQSYPDKYITKMAVESCQLLSTAVYHHMAVKVAPKLFKEFTGLYLPTHSNHPSNIWCRETRSNFDFLCRLTDCIISEYHYRYNKIHKSLECLIQAEPHRLLIPEGPLTSFAQAMPEHYRHSDAVKAYRDYFNGEKQHIMKWTNRPVPEWVEIKRS